MGAGVRSWYTGSQPLIDRVKCTNTCPSRALTLRACLCTMLCSRFQPVHVPEPTVDETFEIMLGLRER